MAYGEGGEGFPGKCGRLISGKIRY